MKSHVDIEYIRWWERVTTTQKRKPNLHGAKWMYEDYSTIHDFRTTKPRRQGRNPCVVDFIEIEIILFLLHKPRATF